MDDLWPFSSNILKITAERNHTPTFNIPESTFRIEQSYDPLNQRRIDAVESGEILQETSIYSTAVGTSKSDASENKMGIDEGYCTGVVFDNLRGKYTAGIARKPDEAEFTIPPTQMQYVSYHKNSAGGAYLCHAKPVQTLTGLREEQKSGRLHTEQPSLESENISKFKSFKESTKEIQKGTEDDLGSSITLK